jgi:PPK2 family polyphosphate:nucleotide phosphotransferase
MTVQQYLLYAAKKHGFLVVLQALDAEGKDGTIRHVMSAMNPQGTVVTGFKEPTVLELDHDFLWRVHLHAPAKGAVAFFNRSHYEDVLIARVHQLVPKDQWSQRYGNINDFEELLYGQNNTRIVKFFLHISKEEQLQRFQQRLDDPARNWKTMKTITRNANSGMTIWRPSRTCSPRPARSTRPGTSFHRITMNHKWFRNLAVSQIVAETMEEMDLKMPEATVDLEVIRRKYHEAAEQMPASGSLLRR